VDRDEGSNIAIKDFLTEKGYQAHVVTEPSEVIVEIKQGRFQLVLLDVSPPGVTGVELLQQIREGDGADQAIDDQAHGAFLVVGADVDHGSCKARIGHARHGDQQLAGEISFFLVVHGDQYVGSTRRKSYPFVLPNSAAAGLFGPDCPARPRRTGQSAGTADNT